MNGHCVRCINRQLISEKDVFLWISKGNLEAETEGELVAVQEQVHQDKYYVIKNTIKTDSKCRLYREHGRQ
jgi:hypothetical protein